MVLVVGARTHSSQGKRRRDKDSIPGLEDIQYGNPLQDFCLENSTGRGVWQAVVHT